MKTNIFWVIINMLLFWAVTDLFEGIAIQEGIVGYVICGGIFGIAMITVIPLIRFFTLPVKFISLFLISVMLSIIMFFLLNIAIPFIDFTDGAIVGLVNRYFGFPEIHLGMMGNVFVGGFVCGALSSVLSWLEED